MKTVFTITLTTFLLALSGHAQTGLLFKKAPAGVEEALRERVGKFFSLQVDNKFRAAESCVCEDTKDYYYNLNKKAPRGFEIEKITFDDSFATADVVVMVSGEIVTMAGVVPLKAPMATKWRIENNQWCYFISERDQKTIRSPFGEVDAEELAKRRKPGSAEVSIKPVTADDVQRSVLVSAQRVIFEAGKKASAEIEFTNTMPGTVKISMEGVLPPGIKMNMSATELKTRETSKVKFEFTPDRTFPEKEYNLMFNVEPTRQSIPVSIVFELPQEIQKTLPRLPGPSKQ